MVDFPRDESLMPTGLDAWPHGKDQCPPESGWLVREERLEARLGVTHFRLPPDHREPDIGTHFANQNVPFVRFPRWHYCHHCGGMETLSSFAATRERCRGRDYPQQSCSARPANRRPFLIPVRFVAVCDLGHIQDFPFLEWLHRSAPVRPDCRLRLRAGRSSAGLSGITIECSCGQKRSMGDVFRFEEGKGGPLARIGIQCKGLRPWLGESDAGADDCGDFLRVLQRGATNVYFPHVVSSIYLPFWAEHVSADVIAILEQAHVWTLLSQSTVNGRIDPMRCEIVAGISGVDAKALEAAAQRKLEGRLSSPTAGGIDEEEFRRSEYQAICDGKVGPQTELFVECADRSSYEPAAVRFFSRIRLVHKLRETRALAGFTRILPPDGTLNSPRLQPLKLDPAIDWLPAIKVYGEGIFLELDPLEIDRWSRAEGVMNRVVPLIARYNAARATRQQPFRNVLAKFVLMHTLAHVIINQLSFDCGYGSASLRERLYCDFTDQTRPMQGILIYTASGDSEGTMGGLVRQAKAGRLEATVRRAIDHAAWCSSDPVCIESRGQGSDSANMAACHSCCLVPETSCEEGNRLLDRALLVGTPDDPALGLFHGLV
jgi:hypothetical protein